MSRIWTRREFLVNTASGVLCTVFAPRFVERAFDHLEAYGEPLIRAPERAIRILQAIPNADGMELHLGDPPTRIPSYTWREYFEVFQSESHLTARKLARWSEELGEEVTLANLDSPCPESFYEDDWCRLFTSNARAFDYLSSLNLGQCGVDGTWEQAGGLAFYDAPGIACNYLGVVAEDNISLTLLQERLNQLGELTKIIIP